MMIFLFDWVIFRFHVNFLSMSILGLVKLDHFSNASGREKNRKKNKLNEIIGYRHVITHGILKTSLLVTLKKTPKQNKEFQCLRSLTNTCQNRVKPTNAFFSKKTAY